MLIRNAINVLPQEARDVIPNPRKIDQGGMEKFRTLDNSEKMIAIPGDRWWPQTAKQEGDNISKNFLPDM